MLPASTIKKLNDHFGQYSIHVQCRACKHGLYLAPVIERMRCSKCNKKNCEVTIGFDTKPRRWNSKP